jgi:hypothetical protein
MDIDVDTELAPLSLAAVRTSLGLCAEHRVELFGLEAS